MKIETTPMETLGDLLELINKDDQALIKGGDCAPWIDPATLVKNVLSKVFNNLGSSTLTPQESTQLNGYLTTLANTQLGQDVLQGLIASPASNLKWTDVNPNGGAAFNGSNTISVNFLAPNEEPAGYTFTNVVHELFHVYQKFVGGDSSTSYKKEVEAYLFAAMVDQEVDNNNNNSTTDVSYYYQSGSVAAGEGQPLPNQAAHDAFDQAWNDILTNKNFSVENVNKLIDNFYNGANISQNLYSPSNGYSPSDVTDLNQVSLNKVFPCFKNFIYRTPETPSGGDGGGGGGTPTGGGGGGDGTGLPSGPPIVSSDPNPDPQPDPSPVHSSVWA